MTFEKKQQLKQIKFRESITNQGFTYILDEKERERNLFNCMGYKLKSTF